MNRQEIVEIGQCFITGIREAVYQPRRLHRLMETAFILYSDVQLTRSPGIGMQRALQLLTDITHKGRSIRD